jgi:hypothetical protein
MVRVGSLYLPLIAVEHDRDSTPLQDDEIGGISPVAVKAKSEEVPVILGRLYNVLNQEDRSNIKWTNFEFRKTHGKVYLYREHFRVQIAKHAVVGSSPSPGVHATLPVPD